LPPLPGGRRRHQPEGKSGQPRAGLRRG
jgi:hypothetical protein